MKKTSLSKIEKGQFFKWEHSNDVHEMLFKVRNEGGYGGSKGEGTSAYVLSKNGFEVSFHLIHRKDSETLFLIEPEDFDTLTEAEKRIRALANLTELYKNAEERTAGENLCGTYPRSVDFGPTNFKRGDIVKDPYGRLGMVLGVDAHSIKFINRVDYRVMVSDGSKEGVGIFRTDEIKKVGELSKEEVSKLKD